MTDPEAIGYEFWRSGRPLERVSYRDLVEAAYGLATSWLAVERPQSEPILLMYPPGRDYLVAIYACLLARRPVIPAYPPSAWNREISLRRLRSILSDAGPATLLCPPAVLRDLTDAGAPLPDRVLAHDVWPHRPPAGAGEVTAGDDDVAVVQYTSGSTAEPRGVVVTHGNLDSNLEAIRQAFALHPGTRAVLWLPPYHDMGLVGGLLSPLHTGFPIRLLSPWEFLKNPVSWLVNVSEFGATASGGPNFAYEICARRVTDEQLERLDLSSWRLAFNGAERVSPATLERFTARFAAAGFDGSAWLPCYGLAESTVLVSAGAWDGTVHHLPRAGSPGERRSRPGPALAGCGRPAPGQQVLVVDPQRLAPLPPGAEGEIWVAGPSVSPGYWRRPEQTAAAFVERDGRRYLRTGDLGFQVEGELFVTGRLKEVIVRHGANVHAEDVEQAALELGPLLRPVAAAFAVDRAEGSLAVLVVESAGRSADVDALAAQLRHAVLTATGVALDAVVVAPPGSVPRTSSGKVQRGECRRRYLTGAYASWARSGAEIGPDVGPSAPEPGVTRLLAELVSGVFAAVCGVERCATTTSLLALGGDSIKAAEIASVLEQGLALPVSVESVLEALTPDRLASGIVDRLGDSPTGLRALEARLERTLAGQLQ